MIKMFLGFCFILPFTMLADNLYDSAVEIPLLKSKPVLDGNSSASKWEKAKRLNLVNMTGGVPDNQTEVSLGHDGENLYVAFKCYEKNMKNIRMQWRNPEERDNTIWTDDCVEIFVDPLNSDPTQTRHIIINAAGVVYDECGTFKGWNSQVRTAVGKGDGFWTVEAEIPLDNFGCKPKGVEIWNCNFARIKVSPSEVSCLKSGEKAPLKDTRFFMPFRFANNEITPPPFVIESLGNGLMPNAKIVFSQNRNSAFIVEIGTLPANGSPAVMRKSECKPGAESSIAYRRAPDDIAIAIKVFESGKPEKCIYENQIDIVNFQETKALAGKTENPLYRELLSDEPAGLAKHGSITWVHGLVVPFMRPFALQYGTRYVADEMYKMFANEKLQVVLNQMFITSKFHEYYKRGVANNVKFAVYPMTDSASKERRHTPFLLDPAVQLEYMKKIDDLAPEKNNIFAVFWGDEAVDFMEKDAIEFFSNKKDSYEFIRNADAEIKEKYGFGKYGIPESADDKNPYRWIAFRHWMNDKLVDFYRRAYQKVKSISPDLLVISDDPTARQDMVYGYSDFAGTSDILTHQLYPLKNPEVECFGFMTKYIADLSGMREVWPVMHVEEYACSFTPEETLEKISESIRCGATGIHWFFNDTTNLRSGKKYLHLEYYGAPDRWQVEMGAAKELEKMNRLRFPDADCAVFAPEPTMRAYLGTANIPSRALYLHSYLAKGAGAWYKFINEGTMKNAKIQQYKVIVTADAKYVSKDVLKSLMDYVAGGGILMVLDAESFSFTPSGDSLASERSALLGISNCSNIPRDTQINMDKYRLSVAGLAAFKIQPTDKAKIIGTFTSGKPAVIENPFGKGKVITFAVNPCDQRLAGNKEWKRFFLEYMESAGVKTKQDIWRFKLPDSIIKPLPTPEGMCLTGNYVQWKQFRPVISANASAAGVYSYNPAPDSPQESGTIKKDNISFEEGSLTDRPRAIYGGNADLGKSDIKQWVTGWNTKGPVSIDFDFKKSYPIDRIVIFYQKYLRDTVISVSEDGKKWAETKFPVSSTENRSPDDVYDKVFKLPNHPVGRFVRISFAAPRNPAETQLILGEVEVWTTGKQ